MGGGPLQIVRLGKEEAVEVARTMYEVQGKSLRQIAEFLKLYDGTLFKWKKKGNWLQRGSKRKEIQEITRQKCLEILAEKGMPPEKAMDLLIKGMTQPMKDQVIGPRQNVTADGSLEESKDMTIVHKGVPDEGIRHKYHHDYLLIAGLIGNAPGLQVNNTGEGSVNVQVNIPPKNGKAF